MRALTEVAHVPAQQGQRGALGALVVLERLPLELDRLTGGGRAAAKHSVHPLDAAPHLVDSMAQVVGDLLNQRVVEYPAFLGGEDLLPVGDLRLEGVQDLSECLLAAALGDVDEQQVVVAAAGVRAHVGIRQLAVEQLDAALNVDAELARSTAHRQQLGRQCASDLERASEGPACTLLGVGWGLVPEDQVQDPSLGKLAERDAGVLALFAGDLVPFVAGPLVALEPDDRDRGALSRSPAWRSASRVAFRAVTTSWWRRRISRPVAPSARSRAACSAARRLASASSSRARCPR